MLKTQAFLRSSSAAPEDRQRIATRETAMSESKLHEGRDTIAARKWPLMLDFANCVAVVRQFGTHPEAVSARQSKSAVEKEESGKEDERKTLDFIRHSHFTNVDDPGRSTGLEVRTGIGVVTQPRECLHGTDRRGLLSSA